MFIEKESPITLISSELNHVKINAKAAKRSNLIKDFNNDFPEEAIELKNINNQTLIKVKEYLEHYENIEPKKIMHPLPKKDFKECVDTWDYDYINLQNESIFEIMLAANFMDIQPLLELASAKIASLIKGKNERQIREILNMQNDHGDECDCIDNN